MRPTQVQVKVPLGRPPLLMTPHRMSQRPPRRSADPPALDAQALVVDPETVDAATGSALAEARMSQCMDDSPLGPPSARPRTVRDGVTYDLFLSLIDMSIIDLR